MHNFEIGGKYIRCCKSLVPGELTGGMKDLPFLAADEEASRCNTNFRIKCSWALVAIVAQGTAARISASLAAFNATADNNPNNRAAESNNRVAESVEHEVSIRGTKARFGLMQKLARMEESTPVLLIENAVGAQKEVDESLTAEFHEECSRFGQVLQVKVAKVRVFVEFANATGIPPFPSLVEPFPLLITSL